MPLPVCPPHSGLLQSAEGRLPMGKQGQAAAASIRVARLALVRSLAASHMAAQQQQQPGQQQHGRLFETAGAVA